MLAVVNPYAAPANLELMLVENAAMQHSLSNVGFSSAMAGSGVACNPP